MTASNVTLSIPLTMPWTNQTLRITEIPNSAALNVFAPVLWADPAGNAIYAYGGESIMNNISHTGARNLFRFSPSGNGSGAWATAETAEAGALFASILRGSRSAATVCNGIGLALSGRVSGFTDDRLPRDSNSATPGLVTYDFGTRRVRNDSIAAVTDRMQGTPAGGAAVCLPDLGASGVVMFLGGRALRPDGVDAVPVSLGQVMLYDMHSRTWLWQSTTGGSPTTDARPVLASRRAATAHTKCRYGQQDDVSASRSWSGFTLDTHILSHCPPFLIADDSANPLSRFVYGGMPASDASVTARDDLWVLSVPAFRWFSQSAVAKRPEPRGFGASAAVGRQMIVVGGVAERTARPYTADKDRDPWSQGVGVLDLNTMAWRSNYDPGAGVYEPPRVVHDWYRAGEGVIWDDTRVKDLFYTSNSNQSPVRIILRAAIGSLTTLIPFIFLYYFIRCWPGGQRLAHHWAKKKKGKLSPHSGQRGWFKPELSTDGALEMMRPPAELSS